MESNARSHLKRQCTLPKQESPTKKPTTVGEFAKAKEKTNNDDKPAKSEQKKIDEKLGIEAKEEEIFDGGIKLLATVACDLEKAGENELKRCV
ncbi:hypothetical protein RIF29_11592 [Crotalaria pallida]|uniref:Uncharacterized protein n=1 Tax=Crotalaria pallida TaxID=3830 RepID=A0AAN9P0A6_CROPI